MDKKCYFRDIAAAANEKRFAKVRKTKEFDEFINELQDVFEKAAEKGYYGTTVFLNTLKTWKKIENKKKLNFKDPMFLAAVEDELNETGLIWELDYDNLTYNGILRVRW